MTWLQSYKLRNFVKSSLWLVPMLCGVMAIVCHRIVWKVDLLTHWELLGYSQDSARSLVGAISAAMLTFIVFLMSMLVIALQVAVGQLTPRIIAFAFQRWVIKMALGIFTFTYMFSIAAIGRIEQPVPQLVVLLTIIFTVASIAVFLYFVDYMGKSLRPISICEELADAGIRIIETIYPVLLPNGKANAPRSLRNDLGDSCSTITNEARFGIIMSFDAEGLVKVAARNSCVIRMVPQVGDFVPNGDPLFNIYQGGECLSHHELGQCLVLGVERTTQQDPEFVFRIIVDIALKALSPAINDPTTSIACIDQLHRLLRRIGQRDLGDGKLQDESGTVRFIFPTPDWEDYVRLAVSEILHFGAESIQVVRRLRAMLLDLHAQLPEVRLPEIKTHLGLLERSVERTFIDPVERALAMSGDYKGLGGVRLQ